jgi:hypothetical protein
MPRIAFAECISQQTLKRLIRTVDDRICRRFPKFRYLVLTLSRYFLDWYGSISDE